MTEPHYGRFDAYGLPLPPPYTPPPPKRDLLPWLIVGSAVLLSGLGLLLVVLLRDGHRVEPVAAAPTTTTATSAPSAGRSTHGGLPGGARVVEEDASVGQARFPGSADTALAWVQAMADGDFQTAYDLSCAAVQQSATDAAAQDGPAWALGTYFFEHTLGGRGFTDGTFDSLIYNSQSDSDVASFTLWLEDGEEFLLLVYVQADGRVCDFV
jgi:hypothetical protein